MADFEYIQVNDKSSHAKRFLEQEEKVILFAELSVRDKLTKADALKLLFKTTKSLTELQRYRRK
jgi:hypothetical protein